MISNKRWKPLRPDYDVVTPVEILGATIGYEPLMVLPINMTMKALSTGEIGLFVNDGGINFEDGTAVIPRLYTDNEGSYDVIVIVWGTKDLDSIAAFFEQLEMQNPDIKSIKKMDEQALHLKSLFQ